ncbi:MAG: cell division protein FtsZ [Maricaulaceae bacterium]
MSINISLPKSVELKPRIVVIGVGGAGGNAVNNMIASGLDGVEFIVANTDAQALEMSSASKRVQMGTSITQGLGAGMRPDLGEDSAEESLAEIMEHLEGTHMLFVAAGMGGGTGTGAAPVIAQAARERGILTVAIVTKPFEFEGSRRMKLANEGVEKLYNSVDTLITIPNQNLFRVATDQTTMSSAFALADEVLHSGVKGVTDLMVVPGLINLDFNDVRTVMDEMGKAMMGTGEATGDNRAVDAAEGAISNPLLDDVSLRGAKGVLINITGGQDLTLYEVHEAATLIRSQVDEDANIIVGSALDPDLDGIIRVSVVATGVEAGAQQAPLRPTPNYVSRPVVETAESAQPSHKAAPQVTIPAVEEDVLTSSELGATISGERSPSAQIPPMPAAEFVQPLPLSSPPMKQPAAQPVVQKTPVASQPAAIAPTPRSTHDVQKVIKRPFGEFFRKKKSVSIAREYQPRPEQQIKTENTGDLFGAGVDDELEIPAFLLKARS